MALSASALARERAASLRRQERRAERERRENQARHLDPRTTAVRLPEDGSVGEERKQVDPRKRGKRR